MGRVSILARFSFNLDRWALRCCVSADAIKRDDYIVCADVVGDSQLSGVVLTTGVGYHAKFIHTTSNMPTNSLQTPM